MEFFQKEIQLNSYPRGYHLITNVIIEAMPDLGSIKSGLMHVFIKHTSASLTINENADPTVRQDFRTYIDKLFPETASYIHSMEGPDDMPAHLKSSVLDSSLTIPISNGRLNLGVWQGVYLCEHRDFGGSRSIVITVSGASQ